MEKVEETSGQLELFDDGRAVGRSGGRVVGLNAVQPVESRDMAGSKPTARPPDRPTGLQRALDRIHTRYGVRGVTRGIQLVALTARAEP